MAPIVLGLSAPAVVRSRKIFHWSGFALSAISIVLLAFFLHRISLTGEVLSLAYPLVLSAEMVLTLKLSASGLCFLLVLELAYGLIFFRLLKEPCEPIVDYLFFFTKVLSIVLVVCAQWLTFGVVHLLAAILFAFLIFFPTRNTQELQKVPAVFFVTQAMAALLFIAWVSLGLLEPSSGHGDRYMIALWLCMAFALPVAPLNSWLERLLSQAPAVVIIAVSIFLSALLFRYLQVGEMLMVQNKTALLPLMVLAGFVVCGLALFRGYGLRQGKSLLATVVQFFVGICLVSFGFSSQETFLAGFSLSMIAPLLVSILLVLEFDGLGDRRQMPLVLGFLVLLVGFPGTAIFGVWAFLGERALQLGGIFPIVLGILWLFYLLLNLLYFREVLVVSRKQERAQVPASAIWAQSVLMLVFMACTWGVTIFGGKLF